MSERRINVGLRGSWLVGVGLLLAAWLGRPALVHGQPAASGISQPANGETISSLVTIEGTATDPNFLRYELAFFREAAPDTGWIVFAEGDRPVIGGALANWDTTVGRQSGNPIFPDGRYQLRLRVVRTDYNYDEYIIAVTVANDAVTPTPTVEAAGAEGRTAQPSATREVEATLPGPGQSGISPAGLPTLTPFPTPSPLPTPLRTALAAGSPDAGTTGSPGGLLGRLAAIDFGRFGQAFWYGVTLTGIVFAAFGSYLLVRNMLRFLWRVLLRGIHRWRLRRRIRET